MPILRPSCLLALMLFSSGCGCNPDKKPCVVSEFGRFDGDVITKWLDDGRKMQLEKDFAYIDANLKRWFAPKNSVVDGASIPQAFWSIIGGPFEGEFRNASIVHDVACVEMKEKWEDVHLMFYQACRCGGVGETKAKIMYYGVYQFGPRWETVHEFAKTESGTKTVARVVRRNVPQPTPEMAKKAKEVIESRNPSLEELKTLTIPQ